MGPPPVIQVAGLSKRYSLGVFRPPGGRLTEVLWEGLARPFRRGPRPERVAHEDFWALRDVSIDVHEGEVLGVIGRNGAGKSTLLKILSRVTEPTEGRAELRGEVGALLEVGTGFHPELTGRENIYLNGGILGMRRGEIRLKLDEIVAFSEIDAFIDTPVKRYSSGMFVRLAFAVAAHLEPEILIIDEVLAVGDVGFQRKCLGKMDEVARAGRTVIFVSHNTGAVAELCTRAILLEGGRKVADGPVPDVLDAYAELMSSGGSSVDLALDPTLPASVTAVGVRRPGGAKADSFDLAEAIEIVVRHEITERVLGYQIVVTLARNSVRLFHSFDTDALPGVPPREPGVYEARYLVPGMVLKAGVYTVDISTGTPERHMQELQAVTSFEIEERSVNAHAKGYRRDRPGHIVGPGTWVTERIA